MTAVGSSYINKMNKIKVLELIRSTESISRADIAKKAGLSPPTVTRIVDSLIHTERLVVEIGMGESLGGRPPNLVTFAGHDKYIIGIDLGRTAITGVITNLKADIIAHTAWPSRCDEGDGTVFDRIAEMVNGLVIESGVPRESIYGVGLAIAGLINNNRTAVVFSPYFNLQHANIRRELSRRVQMPVLFDNVTRCMAIGELFFGAGRTYKNYICMNIGYGIGTGIVLNGKPFTGTHGFSGEFGHTVIEPDSTVECMCGNYGCLEAVASGHAIAETAKAVIAAGRPTLLAELCGGDLKEITAEMVFQAAARGDCEAEAIVTAAIRRLGCGVVNLINIFDPEAIIIGGGIALAGEMLLKPIRSIVAEKSMSHLTKEPVAILPATFGLKASVTGAVGLVLHDVLHLDIKLPEAAEQSL